MGRKISKTKIEEIMAAISTGESYRQISKKFNISIGMISKIKAENGITVKKTVGGRPQKLKPQSIMLLRQIKFFVMNTVSKFRIKQFVEN